ncbi:MAG: ATP-binding protein [Sandaracinaceae bacterium]|nr:ATP-binding protein [Sandaracinaceae bacterium]
MEGPDLREVVQRYIGFGEEDSRALAGLHAHAAPRFGRIVDHFYECIALDPGASAVMADGAQIERLKRSLHEWLASGMLGPHDDVFLERRLRIGRRHVQIALPQRYMLTAMSVIRLDLQTICDDALRHAPAERLAASTAVDKWLDMELAIMLETYKEDSEAQLRRRERLASIGQLAGTIGHELRNPLAVIESSLYLLRPAVGEDARAMRHVTKIASQLQVAKETITQLLEMTRERAAARARFDLAALAAEVVEAVPRPPDVDVGVAIPPGLSLDAERPLVSRALANLVANSVAAIGSGRPGRVTIEAREEGDEVLVVVADDGPGFDPEILPRAFEPLVTGRPDGIGLGLALVRNVCERHDARVSAENPAGGGGRVTMRFGAGGRS